MPQETYARRQQIISIRGFDADYESNSNVVGFEIFSWLRVQYKLVVSSSVLL